MKNLKSLLSGMRYNAEGSLADFKINGVTCDSRSVKKGDLFIAVKGASLDGNSFINEALSRGAKAVLTERRVRLPAKIKRVLIDDARRALPVIADNLYGSPSRNLRIIGVTGTNGKTTVTHIIENILNKASKKTGVIGTINYRYGGKTLAAPNTTPGPLELHSLLRKMADVGVSYVVMEASSHSLEQHRIDRVLFNAAIFTNLSGEHLDYHKTLRNYLNAKAGIFDKLKDDGVAILNADDKKVIGLRYKIKKSVVTYGIEHPADVTAKDIRISLDGSEFVAVTPKAALDMRTRLVGNYNVSNALAAIAASLAEGINLDSIKDGMESLSPIPGRLESIESNMGFKVFVDFAHTHEALYNVLRLLKSVSKRGSIITVFGCGGNRDRKKRPLMGRAACGLSDRVIITQDNPRFERTENITKDIERGIKGRFSNYDIIDDRFAAIEKALESASEGDAVLIAGKGHEKYQIIKDEMIPFDDCEVARRILNNIENRR